MNLLEPGFPFWIVPLTMGMYLGFWIYALINLLRADFKDSHQKLVWMLLLIFVPVIGTFLYLSMARTMKKRRRFDPDFSNQKNDFSKYE